MRVRLLGGRYAGEVRYLLPAAAKQLIEAGLAVDMRIEDEPAGPLPPAPETTTAVPIAQRAVMPAARKRKGA